jgi:DNA-binding response OmpR family regulator
VICEDGANALEKVREIKPDAVLLDIVLPGQDGLTIYDRLKSESDTAGIPVIFLTCQDRYRHELRSRQARWYLGKPFELDDLLAALDQAFSTTHRSALAS